MSSVLDKSEAAHENVRGHEKPLFPVGRDGDIRPAVLIFRKNGIRYYCRNVDTKGIEQRLRDKAAIIILHVSVISYNL